MPNNENKISPESESLRLNTAQPRRLKQGPIIVVSLIALGIVVIAFSVAMLREPRNLGVMEKSLVPADENRLPDFVKTGPRDYSELPREVPKLGEPLSGDMGHVGVPAKTTTFNIPVEQPKKKELSAEEQRLLQEYMQALRSDVFVSSVSEETKNVSLMHNQTENKSSSPDSNRPVYSPDLSVLEDRSIWDSQNKQEEKKLFLDKYKKGSSDYLQSSLSPPISPYEVKAGTVIPITLITGINSDLPGQITGQVRENVFDTVTGNYLLIPQGTRLIGLYDSGISFGQERVLVVWNRLILPNGYSVNLEGMPGVDLSGYAGFKDKVDNHWLQLAGGVVLSSILSAAVTSSQGSQSGFSPTLGQGFVSSAGRDINRTGQKIVEKMLNRQPSITIAPGFSVNVFVNKDIILEPYTINRGRKLDSYNPANQG